MMVIRRVENREVPGSRPARVRGTPCGVAFSTLVDLNKLARETPSFEIVSMIQCFMKFLRLSIYCRMTIRAFSYIQLDISCMNRVSQSRLSSCLNSSRGPWMP